MSAHTGAYSDARQRMPLEVAEKVADRVFEHLLPRREALPGWDRQVFIVDGSTLELPHTPELVKCYPPATNQHGTSHWPVMEILVAQELTSGIAGRPCWGPMYGPQAVSEQSLTEQILERLPDHAVFMGDINFGVFSVAFATTQRGHDVLLRLKADRAEVIGRGGPALTSGTDRQVVWRPSPQERKKHPNLPADACVRGRLIVQQVSASNGDVVMLYLFTTLDLSVDQLLQLYGDRWNVETDLRSLKQTLNLQMLRCQSADMIAKELILAITGYNFRSPDIPLKPWEIPRILGHRCVPKPVRFFEVGKGMTTAGALLLLASKHSASQFCDTRGRSQLWQKLRTKTCPLFNGNRIWHHD